MDIQKVKRSERKQRKIPISIRVTEQESKFIADHKISPTALFSEALKEIREKYGKPTTTTTTRTKKRA